MRWLVPVFALLAIDGLPLESGGVPAAPGSEDRGGQPASLDDLFKGERPQRLPSPYDPGMNEGLQGRRNATEDASRVSQGPWNDRGFLGFGSYY